MFEGVTGLVIINSCCHGGVDNVVDDVMISFPEKKILAMIGGFHLMGSLGPKFMRGKSEDVRALGNKLLELDVKQIYTGHCTGNPAYNILKGVLGERLQQLRTSTIVEL